MKFKGKGCKMAIKTIEVNGDTIHSSEMTDHIGHRTSVSDNDSMILAGADSFWKAF